jgi:amino acid transporter
MIVGAGVFITIPLMLQKLPGPYAILGWLAAGALILVDGLVWSELGAALPGSGGSYLYLLESYGRERWGRMMAFLFIWNFLMSGPLELASGLIAVSIFLNGISPGFKNFNEAWTVTWKTGEWSEWNIDALDIQIGPSRLIVLLLGIGIVALVYRRITALGRLTVTFWLGVLLAIAWILVEGFSRFDPNVAFDSSGDAAHFPDLTTGLGAAMILAMYSYLGYYNVCYIGDEVRDPGRTIPRSIMLSALLVCVLFAGLHLAMLGTVPWASVPTEKPQIDEYSLPATFMETIHGDGWQVPLVSLLVIWSCIGAAFAGLVGYSRIPYGAARFGHFYGALARVHPVHHIPHVSTLLVGGLMLFWTFFDLGSVINALICTRILNQFVGQIVGLALLRQRQPGLVRPFRIWLYPLPCGLALAGWLYMYACAGLPFIVFGLVVLALGVIAFFLWQGRSNI